MQLAFRVFRSLRSLWGPSESSSSWHLGCNNCSICWLYFYSCQPPWTDGIYVCNIINTSKILDRGWWGVYRDEQTGRWSTHGSPNCAKGSNANDVFVCNLCKNICSRMGFPVVQVVFFSKESVILPDYREHPHVKNISHTIHSIKLDLIIPFSCMHAWWSNYTWFLNIISNKKTRKMQIKWLIDTLWGVITETNGPTTNKMTLSACY